MIHDYKYIPELANRNTDGPLHGSGGTEEELFISHEVGAGSPMLGVRGTVAIDGGFAFFHRRPDRSIDEADIGLRVPVLAEFISAARDRDEFSDAPIAGWVPNGSIMAAALLLTNRLIIGGDFVPASVAVHARIGQSEWTERRC